MGTAILRAIAMEIENELQPQPTNNNRNRLHTASAASFIRRRFHPLGSRAALHSSARTKFESVLIQALDMIDPDIKERVIKKMEPMDEEDTETILEFAECIDPTELFNCSLPTINQFRTIDGTCNNLLRPLEGASNTEFRRILPAQYEDGILVPIGHDQQVNGNAFGAPWPSARSVSQSVVRDLPRSSNILSHIFMLWVSLSIMTWTCLLNLKEKNVKKAVTLRKLVQFAIQFRFHSLTLHLACWDLIEETVYQ